VMLLCSEALNAYRMSSGRDMVRDEIRDQLALRRYKLGNRRTNRTREAIVQLPN
jgi:hypothetical protein